MASVRKRKMARSSVKKSTRRNKDKQRKVHILSNQIIADNWDKSLTLKQNYAKLGLKFRLGTDAGGQEKKLRFFDPDHAENEEQEESEDDGSGDEYDPKNIPKGMAKIKRDENGNVLEVIYGENESKSKKAKNNNEIEEQLQVNTDVVKQLEELAEKGGKGQKKRHLSEREIYWLGSLVEKYGDNYEKMKWDKKLNPNQYSAGELRKRIFKLNQQVGL